MLREAAAQVLAMVAERGDDYVCGLLRGHLEDGDQRVKRAVKAGLRATCRRRKGWKSLRNH